MKRRFEAIAIGVSAGGLEALGQILPVLPATFSLPIFIVQHLQEDADDFLAVHLDRISAVRVKEAEDKEQILPGRVYVAPAGYHLLIEEDRSFSLSIDARVNHARPSIDVLFQSAADVYEENLVGVILTGASSDGAKGLKMIKERGGWTIVQDPTSAKAKVMPEAAIRAASPNRVIDITAVGDMLIKVGTVHEENCL